LSPPLCSPGKPLAKSKSAWRWQTLAVSGIFLPVYRQVFSELTTLAVNPAIFFRF